MWQDTSVAAVCILMSVFATLYRLCVCRFEEMNVTESLRDNLTGRMIIEHPTVHICTVQNHSWETSFTTPIHLLLYLLITLIRHNERHVYANVECEDILAGRQVIVWAVLNSTLVILHMCAKISVMIQLRADSKICNSLALFWCSVSHSMCLVFCARHFLGRVVTRTLTAVKKILGATWDICAAWCAVSTWPD